MPPPIQSQSGSRAALVTWTVVSCILFVIATVLAIFSGVARNRAEQEKTNLQQQFEKVVSANDLGGDMVNTLQAAKTANPTAYTGNLLNVALTQRDQLARKLAGGGSADEAMKRVDDTLSKIKADPALKLGGDNLNAVASGLYGAVRSRDQQIAQLTAALKALTDQFANVKAAIDTQIAASQSDLAKANGERDQAVAGTASYRTEKDKDIEQAKTAADEQSKVVTDTVNQLSAQLQEAQTKAKRQDDQIKALQNKLAGIRQPVDQISRVADGHIMRTGSDGVVYIDLGTGDQVSPGMSFEVYDRIQGIPKIGDPTNDEALPKGKASIEIIKVNPGSSECRVVRTTPGDTLVEGDIVSNIVYDKNVKYNVMVYGNFDLDRNGQATPQDADVVKRLVTRWGGKVVNKLDANTDFLVIGKMPTIPNYTQEERDRPEIQFELERREKELADYNDVLAQAVQYNIPVLNQNRFLYMTGYYQQSAR